MSDDAARIEQFWRWFATGPARWASPDDDSADAQARPLLEELARRFPELVTGFSWTPSTGLFGIQFSARSRRPALAPFIRALVAAAPHLERWRFKAFQDPLPIPDVWVAHLGLPFDELPYDLLRVEVIERHPRWALRVFVPSFAPELVDGFATAVNDLLEALLGEAWLLEELARLEIADLHGAPADAAPITTLAQIVGRTGA
jgi:hypothetical protein